MPVCPLPSLSCSLQTGGHLDHVEQQDRGNLGPWVTVEQGHLPAMDHLSTRAFYPREKEIFNRLGPLVYGSFSYSLTACSLTNTFFNRKSDQVVDWKVFKPPNRD